MNTTLIKKIVLCTAAMIIALSSVPNLTFADSAVDEKYGFAKSELAVYGDDDESIVFVIMGDGFAKSEQELFNKKARELMQYITATPPFDELKEKMNFYAIDVVSAESGASDSRLGLKNTYFGSCYRSAYNIDRLLAPQKYYRAYALAEHYVPDYDKILLLVNDKRYGGSGGDISTASINSESYEIMLHEMGHSIGMLADEYWAGEEYADEYPNMSASDDPESVPWSEMIDNVEIGIYPYPENPEWFHPSLNCKMQYLGKDHPFCKVCRKEIKERLQDYLWKTHKIQTTYDLINRVKIKSRKRVLSSGAHIPSEEVLSIKCPSNFNIVSNFTEQKITFDNLEVKLSFKIKDKKIAVVSNDGTVTAKKAGKTVLVVSAELADGTKKVFNIKLKVEN